MPQYNQQLYDSVTDAWTFILGENLHYGYFKSADMLLKTATDCMIDVLTGMGHINKNSKVLDVGCGIGGPAIYLHEKFQCHITGITNSPRGLELAGKASDTRGYSDSVQFELADALGNGFYDNSFDYVWQMESSHLMPDKEKLFSENFRVLENHGAMLLCDLILKKDFSFKDLHFYRKELNVLEESFGRAKMETLETYDRLLHNAGFIDIEIVDISLQAKPTLTHWQNNIQENRENILKHLSNSALDNFLLSCDILREFFENNLLGYGLIKAKKPGGSEDHIHER
jgi:27-O-demethylrifamycin SV methyltransferase